MNVTLGLVLCFVLRKLEIILNLFGAACLCIDGRIWIFHYYVWLMEKSAGFRIEIKLLNVNSCSNVTLQQSLMADYKMK